MTVTTPIMALLFAIANDFFIFKVAGSAGTFSKTASDTFGSVLMYGKEQEPRKRIFHNRVKNFIFLRG